MRGAGSRRVCNTNTRETHGDVSGAGNCAGEESGRAGVARLQSCKVTKEGKGTIVPTPACWLSEGGSVEVAVEFQDGNDV